MTAADSGLKMPQKGKLKAVELNSFTAAAGCITLIYFLTMLMVTNRCRKRAAEELPLRQIFDDVCRTVEAYGYAKFADTDAAIMCTGSRFATLGDAPFYRGSVNTGDGQGRIIHCAGCTMGGDPRRQGAPRSAAKFFTRCFDV